MQFSLPSALVGVEDVTEGALPGAQPVLCPGGVERSRCGKQWALRKNRRETCSGEGILKFEFPLSRD